MNKSKISKHNDKLVDLSDKVVKASDNDIPKLLLKLQDLLADCKNNIKALLQLKKDAWDLDLLHVLSLSLKQDFPKVEGQWQTAAKLVHLLSEFCVGLDPKGDDAALFRNNFLPETVANCLIIAKKSEARYSKMSKVLEDRRNAVFTAFHDVMGSLTLLMSAHNFLAVNVLQSTVFLQMLMTDDKRIVLTLLSTIQSANRSNDQVIQNLKPKSVQGLLDEVIYKLSVTTSDEVASTSCHTLLVMCDSCAMTVELLCERYKADQEETDEGVQRGLRPLLNKWKRHGFDRDLQRLNLLLEAGSVQQAEEERISRAASVIQAWWKSHSTRKQLKQANTAITKFQQSFRTRKETEQQRKEDYQLRTELEHRLTLSRKRAMRQLHEKRLHAIEFLPAGEVDKHLAREQHDAAVRIQKTFRGYIAKKYSVRNRQNKRRNQAARVIQRRVRKWLKETRLRRLEPPNWQRTPGITEARRVALQEQIATRNSNHVATDQTEEERKVLHEKVQDLLKRQVMGSRLTRKCQQRRETLLAQLSVDSTLLMEGPGLADITETQAEAYVSYSVPVTTRARFNHSQELRLLQQPWWRRLGDQYQDAKIDEELDWKVF